MARWRLRRGRGDDSSESRLIGSRLSPSRFAPANRGIGNMKINLETIFYEPVADGVATLTLNRPEHANAVVPEMARDLLTALSALEDDQKIRVLILTGAGRQFCAGADLA